MQKARFAQKGNLRFLHLYAAQKALVIVRPHLRGIAFKKRSQRTE